MNSGLNKLFISFISLLVAVFLTVTIPYVEADITDAPPPAVKKDMRKELTFIEGLLDAKEYYTFLGYAKSLLNADAKVWNLYSITNNELSILNAKAGSGYLKIGAYGNAEFFFKESLSLNQNALEVMQGLQEIYFLQKDYPLSLKYYDTMLLKTGFDKIPLKYHYISLISCFKIRDNKKFETISKKLPLMSKKNIFPYIQYVQALAATRKDSESGKVSKDTFAMFDQLAANKNYPSKIREKTLLTKGMILFEDASYESSIKVFNKLEKTPVADSALYGTIWDYIKLEQYNNAFKKIDLFLRLYKQSDHYEDIIMLKGQLFKKIKKFEESVTSYEEAKEEFQKAVALITGSMAKNKYVKTNSSLFEVAEFPNFRYSPSFRYMKLKSTNRKMYLEKRILKSVAKKNKLYNSLSSLISVRRLMDARIKTQIKLQAFVNKYDYNIFQLRKTIKRFRNKLSQLKKIKIDNLKQRIEKDYLEGGSISTDISSFASRKEKILLEEIKSKVVSARRFLHYVKSSSRTFKITEKKEFFKEIQKVMLASPVFKADKLGLKEKIVAKLAGYQTEKNTTKFVITPKDEQFIEEMENTGNKIREVNKKMNTLMWAVGSIMFEGNESQKTYWKDVHKRARGSIAEIKIVAQKLEDSTYGLKSVMEKTILEKVKVRKIDFKERVRKLEQKIAELDISIRLLIIHIESLIEEMKPMQKSMSKASKMVIWLENKSINLLSKVSNNFRKTFLTELKKKAAEYTMLIEEADYEIADNLFQLSTGK